MMHQRLQEIMYLTACMPNPEPMFPPTPKKWRGGKVVVHPVNQDRRDRKAICKKYGITMKKYRKLEKKAYQQGLPAFS